jgi:hypothetical protein
MPGRRHQYRRNSTRVSADQINHERTTHAYLPVLQPATIAHEVRQGENRRRDHPLLTPRRPDSPMPGINGIAVHDGWVVT